MKTIKKKEPSFLSKSSLKKRGWTDAIIVQLFPEPTKETANPHYRSGPKMKLYDEVKVKAIEKTKKFQEMTSAALKRSQTAKSVAAKRQTDTINWAKTLPEVVIRKYSQGELYKKACQHYNDLWASRGKDKYATVNESKEFLNRISHNYLRHELSNYEELIGESFGKIGADEARVIIREHIQKAIFEMFPYLK